jgi:transcriptional regulator with XRE-family HTH domain
MATGMSMTEVLRRAIRESGLTMLTIAEDTGIQRASLIRFARGDQSLRLDVADKLAAYFGLRLTPVKKT